MRELKDKEIKEVKVIWDLISTGRAANTNDKTRAINFWNSIAGTHFKTNSSCSSCLGAVFNGVQKLYNKYYELD